MQKFIGECFRTEDILWCNFLSRIQTMLGQSFKQFICFTDIGVIFFHWYKQCLDRVLSSLFLSQIKTMHFLSRIETVLEQTFMQFYMFHRWKQYLVTALKLKSFSCIKLWSFVEVPCSKSNNITGWAPKSICKEPHYPVNKSIFDLYAVNGFNFIRDLLMY